MKLTPRISANGLVEYCYATPVRRTSIIENAIKPANYLLDTRYNDIERATMGFVQTRGSDSTTLDALDQSLLLREATSSHEEQRLLTAHDAIELARSLDLSSLPSGQLSCLPDKQPSFGLEGVEVSVRPTNLISVKRSGRIEADIGLVKTYICKSRPLTSEAAALHGALMLLYAHRFYTDAMRPNPDLFATIDIFQQEVFRAPRNYLQRSKMLAAACREISDRWSAIRLRVLDAERRKSGRL
jgi:hypothetical protein